ncbi:HWE histidine kinase domain-containing protein [Paeniroseomonas aquatica]|uniref:HWE histidine kinase domain-containing protein n=1 Tax=Paeniroseomonas aquatica TaxID=373043 RepID=UPI003620846C
MEFTGETARAPGERRDWVEHFYPVRDPETEEVMGIGLICEEVTGRKRAERARELLLRELDHRVKNLFAIIGGLVSFTARAAPDAQAMRNILLGRIQALAQAHDLVRPALGGAQELRPVPPEDAGTTLGTLAAALLHPFHAAPGVPTGWCWTGRRCGWGRSPRRRSPWPCTSWRPMPPSMAPWPPPPAWSGSAGPRKGRPCCGWSGRRRAGRRWRRRCGPASATGW